MHEQFWAHWEMYRQSSNSNPSACSSVDVHIQEYITRNLSLYLTVCQLGMKVGLRTAKDTMLAMDACALWDAVIALTAKISEEDGTECRSAPRHYYRMGNA